MKACPVCGRLYPPDAGFCPADGQELISATQVPVVSSDQDARIGQVLCGRYQVRRVVADGGMGRVYEALDMVQRRNCALKVLHPEVTQDEVALERFKREFEVSKQLPHRHIVEVLDFQPTHDGSYALVMEFLYGEELRATLKRQKTLPPGRVVRMISQIALALDPAHERKLVHRDLKPDNVFLCQTSQGDIVKILDFGSVKDKADSAKKLTVMGTTIGSPFYMAPEQAQGLETLDHRADVWALAAIVYECVTGAVPFFGNNGPSILLEILTKEPIPPSKKTPGLEHPVPATLDRVMAHAFKKAANVRIPSVGALADAVGAAYGLTGKHESWAETDEATLAQTISVRLPELVNVAPAPGPSGGVVDEFFGDEGALDDPFGPNKGVVANLPGAAPAHAAWQSQADLAVSPGVPRSNTGLVVAIVTVAALLIVGVVILAVVL